MAAGGRDATDMAETERSKRIDEAYEAVAAAFMEDAEEDEGLVGVGVAGGSGGTDGPADSEEPGNGRPGFEYSAKTKSSAGPKSRPRHRKANIVAVAVIAVVVVAVFAGYSFYGSTTPSESAIVVDADGNEYVLPLDEDTTLEVTTSLGTNIVMVEDGCVWVEEADCPNQDCVEQGKVSSAGAQIICLPHEMVITITDEYSESDFDVVGS